MLNIQWIRERLYVIQNVDENKRYVEKYMEIYKNLKPNRIES